MIPMQQGPEIDKRPFFGEKKFRSPFQSRNFGFGAKSEKQLSGFYFVAGGTLLEMDHSHYDAFA